MVTTDGISYVYCFRPLTTVPEPSKCIIIGDTSNGAITLRATENPPQHHNEGGNMGFLDGHAKWLSYNDLRQANNELWFGGIAH